MKLHVPAGPLPLLPPYFSRAETTPADWEEIDLGNLVERPAMAPAGADDLIDVDLADLFSTPTTEQR